MGPVAGVVMRDRRSVWLALALMASTVPAIGRAQQVEHHHHYHHMPAGAGVAPGSPSGSPSTEGHHHDVGPAGTTYDLRWLDAMVQHHTGALRMSELVFDVGSAGVGALAKTIWNDQAQEIKAMLQWRKAWYPEAPVYPVALRPGGNPDSQSGLERMGIAQIAAMQMMGQPPSRANRITWFLEGMIQHHGGALQMAHDALAKSTNTTVRRLARQIIVGQRREILELRRMLIRDGLNRPEYYRFDQLFTL